MASGGRVSEVEELEFIGLIGELPQIHAMWKTKGQYEEE